MSKHILIVGTGSVGRRHAKNLKDLGCEISCMDPRQDRIAELSDEIQVVKGYTTLQHALRGNEYCGVVIASPPAFHVEQTITALEAGLPVLLEKPVCPAGVDAHRLRTVEKKKGVPILLGYTWRWWPPLAKVKELLSKNAIGTIRNVQFMMSAHLADWHPWEKYQEFFMSSKEQGGGALLDESHWIDLMYWLFGKPESVFAKIDKISDLEITSDDNVDMIISYKNDMVVSMHLDLYGRPHQKYIRFIGEEGSIYWTVEPNRVSISKKMENEWNSWEYEYERNDMFVSVSKEFLEVIDGKSPETCLLDEGVDVLDFIEAARASSNLNSLVKLKR